MLGKILKLFVGDKSKKDLKLINPIIEKIHSFEQEMNSLSNDELRAQTQEFKKQIKDSTSEIEEVKKQMQILMKLYASRDRTKEEIAVLEKMLH